VGIHLKERDIAFQCLFFLLPIWAAEERERERRLSPPLGHFLLVYRTEVMKQARQAAKVAIHLATCVSICISHAAIIKKCGYNCSFLMQTYNIIYLSYNDFIYSVCEEHWKLSVARVKSEFSGHDTYQSRKCKYNQNSLSIHLCLSALFKLIFPI